MTINMQGAPQPSTGHEQPDCPTLSQQLFPAASISLLLNAGYTTLPPSMPSTSVLLSVGTPIVTPIVTSVSVVNDFRPRISSVNASSHGQIFVGANINCSHAQPADVNSKKPFTLKFSIKICQSCRRNYEGPNDTMGLVVARAERRLVSNLSTGTQFLGKESNSYYHLHIACLKAADCTFNRDSDLVIPDEVISNLQTFLALKLQCSFTN